MLLQSTPYCRLCMSISVAFNDLRLEDKDKDKNCGLRTRTRTCKLVQLVLEDPRGQGQGTKIYRKVARVTSN